MHIHVQHEDRGNITLVWVEDATGDGHVFTPPPQGYHNVVVEAPTVQGPEDHRHLATIRTQYRVHTEQGHAVLVAK